MKKNQLSSQGTVKTLNLVSFIEMLEDDKAGARIETDLWFSFMELEVVWTAEFIFFILLNEVLEAAGNPFLGSSTLTYLTTSTYEFGLEQEPVLSNEFWCVSLW